MGKTCIYLESSILCWSFFYVSASRLPIISNILSGKKLGWNNRRRRDVEMGSEYRLTWGKNHLSSFGGWRTNNFHLCSLFYSFSFIGTRVCVLCSGTEQCKKTQHGNPQISLQNKAAFKLERIWRNQEELLTAVEFYAHTIFIKKYTATMTTSEKNQ